MSSFKIILHERIQCVYIPGPMLGPTIRIFKWRGQISKFKLMSKVARHLWKPPTMLRILRCWVFQRGKRHPEDFFKLRIKKKVMDTVYVDCSDRQKYSCISGRPYNDFLWLTIIANHLFLICFKLNAFTTVNSSLIISMI